MPRKLKMVKRSRRQRRGRPNMKRNRKGPSRGSKKIAIPSMSLSSATKDTFCKNMSILTTVGYSPRYQEGDVSVIYPMFNDGFAPSSGNFTTGFWSWLDIDRNLLAQADFGYLFQTYQSFRVNSINVTIRFKDSAITAKYLSTTSGASGMGITSTASYMSAVKLLDSDTIQSNGTVSFSKYFGTDPVATLGDIHGTSVSRGPNLRCTWRPVAPTDYNYVLTTGQKFFCRILYCTDYKMNYYIDGLSTSGINADIRIVSNITFMNLVPNGVQSTGRINFKDYLLTNTFESI